MARLQGRSITQRTVEALWVAKDTVFWDAALPGFGVRAYPSGSRYYMVQARGPDGSKRVTLGRHGVITADEARRRAAVIIARIKAGDDPIASPTVATPGDEATVAAVAARYLREHVAVHCKPTTAAEYRRVVDMHLVPALGELAITAVGRTHVADLHYGLRDRPSTANLVVATLSRLIEAAAAWGVAPAGSNPCRHVRKYRVGRRERFLTDAEFRRLGRVLSDLEAEGRVTTHAAAAIRLLMLTGCRRNEILTLRWEDVDLEAKELRLPDSKTGPRVVSLAPAAVEVLAELPRVASNPWVIPGRKPGARLSNISKHWSRARTRAGLEDVRIHDLRHSFASRALALGESLPVIARLLGHAQVQTTARYAHLARDSVKASAARVAASIGEDILPADFGLDAAPAPIGSDAVSPGRGL